ncbi:hypothetical protein [Kocuria sp. TGY1127_2]|uniref:hypothetical protein n=1 Tax=Kocuria sp. TGY1127_2 TaxID=2711328 RepID=UPI0015BBD84A|nr:hypothetical protein [Kocuria sp. TGY1127_2]
MATGFGLDIDQNGNGTAPDDIQRIIGANWRVAGILSGCAVETTSTMQYHVFAGAVVMNWGMDQKVLVPVEETRIPVDPNPGTTSRRDKIYVQQRTTEADGDNLAVVASTPGALPARSILLADYEVPANSTSTSGAIDRANRVYTRSVGGQYGQVAKFIDTDSSVHGKELIKRGQQQLWFGAMWNGVAPTDRDLMIHFNSCISAGPNQGADPEGSVIYKFYLNDALVYSVERVFNKYWESKHYAFPVVIEQANNTIHYTVQWSSGASSWAVRYGGANKAPGDQMVVVDNGVANL